MYILINRQLTKVKLRCNVNSELINQHMNQVYKQEVPRYNLKRIFKIAEPEAKLKDVKIKTFVRIKQDNLLIQNFPLTLTLHYPNMKVKPDVLKFNPTLIGYTKKMMFSIYNHSSK